MEKLFTESLNFMESMFDQLSKQVQPPIKKDFGNSFVFRYENPTVHHAIILKLARSISCLYSAKALFEKGLFQDQSALHRMIDEFHEDILFMVYGITNNDLTPLHEKYLEAFIEEEFDNENSAIESTQKRPMIPRQKIRAYISRVEGAELDESSTNEILRTLNKSYSGYVHGASTHILDMYGGYPPHFHLSGMLGTPRQETQLGDLWNYFYRSILSLGFIANAFEDQKAFNEIIKFRNAFEKVSGTSCGEQSTQT